MPTARLRVLPLLLAAGCVPAQVGDRDDSQQAASTSASASLVVLRFDGRVELDGTEPEGVTPEAIVRDQLRFAMGQLKQDQAGPRLALARLDGVELVEVAGARSVRYRAELPVAWGAAGAPPARYVLRLPRVVSDANLHRLYAKYVEPIRRFNRVPACLGDDPLTIDIARPEEPLYWYDFAPQAPGCAVEADDLVALEATVERAAAHAHGKYPEYDRVWRDGELRIVAVFAEDLPRFATSAEERANDAGVRAYDRFIAGLRASFASAALATSPAVLRDAPGAYQRDVELRATFADGRRVVVNVLLVNDLEHPENAVPDGFPTFFDRYASLTPRADLIVYGGHSGLGPNVERFLSLGRFEPGQYTIFYVNACSSWGFVGSDFLARRAALDPDDPAGTRYADVVSQALPAYFSSLPGSVLGMVEALVDPARPVTYEQILARFDPRGMAVVDGDEDNAFTPRTEPRGLSVFGTADEGAEQRYATALLSAGTYVIQLVGNGDADLYVRRGREASRVAYDCRSMNAGSEEQCTLRLDAPDVVYATVRSRAGTATFHLTIGDR